MGNGSGGRTLEGLIDELAQVFHEAGEARELAQRAGFPAADLPGFDTAAVFWSRVVRAADVGKTVGGVAAIVEQAKATFPGNRFFAAYGSGTSAPTSASTVPEPRGGPSIDNRGANIGQQIVVHGNASFGAMTVSMPGRPSGGSGGRGAPPAPDGPAPPPRIDDLGARPRASDASIDVVIITAAEGEDTALLEVSEGVLSPWTKIPSPQGYASEVYRAAFDSLATPGRPIHVITTRPPRMGGDHAANAAGLLVGAFEPRCIAMCGVCAGRPEWTELGDVLIAERVWRYDTGERVNAVPGGRPVFKKDTELFSLSAKWLRAAENAAKEWKTWPGRDDAWLRARPRPLELQASWLMKELAEERDPAAHPDVERLCASWSDVVEQLVADGLVEDGQLTDSGRKHLRGMLFKHKGLPEPAAWAVHVGPVATGNRLVRDVDIWQELEDEQRLVRGFDMELAAVGAAGWASEIPFLAVKGVMDFGLPHRHRGFRPFAARASAEVLVRLLRTVVVPSSGGAVASPTGRERNGIGNLGERPPVFEGRADELERIREALGSSGTAAVFSAVVGLGGVGKSRLAFEYAFEGDYDVRWWVRAGASATVHEDLVRLGQRLGLFGEVGNVERAVDEVLEWLSTHERWLLVLDDVRGPDELREALKGRLGRLGRGHVLITSRAKAWRGLAKSIEITTLSPEAARAVLLERSGRPDDGFADAVAERLGYLPLALVQAGAFVEANRCPFGEYLELLAQHGIGMFDESDAATGDYYESTVAVTWAISLKAMRGESPAAKALLDWLAFLDPDGVPLRLLREHGQALSEPLAECVGSARELNRAMAALLRYSMVERVDRPEDALRVHRLVQEVTRHKLGEEGRRELAAAVVRWVRGVFAYEPDVTRIADVPEGIGEQLMAVGEEDACVATSGPALTWALSGLADYRMRRGMLAAARLAGERSLQVAEGLAKADPHSAQAQRDLSVSLNKLGEVEVQAGNLAAARDLFQRCTNILEGLAKADPHSAQAQRDLSISLENLGNVEVQAGNLAAARNLFQRYRDIAEGLAKADPHSAQAQRDLSVSLDKLGEVEVQAGNLAAARDLFQRCTNILEGLAKADPHSAQAQRDLSVSLNKLGEVEVQAGNLAAARDLFQRCTNILEGLAKADPHSAQAQRDLSVSLNELGDVEVQAGNLAAARDLFQRSLQVAEGLAKADPHSAQAQRDLSVSLNKLGDVEVQAGNLAAARDLFQRSLQVAEGLAKADPHSAQAQRDLSVSLNKLGDVEVQAGNLAAARDLFQRSLQTREGLAKADPHSAQAQRDLSVSLNRLGDVEVQAGNLAAARDLFQRYRDIAEGLAKADPHSAQAQRDLSVSLDRLGDVEVQAGNLAAARDLFQRDLEIAEGLAKADPHSAQASFDVVLSLLRFAALAEQEGDLDALRKVVTTTNERLDAMDAKGQITGYKQREAVRKLFKDAAAKLRADE
ncbi:tetratricopeptide repeat protein [Paraliomyxa miuraensis]|uniref:tetratricopeptide repeat protein n=1 Tax=Paraliomyxa miuraensis TaxID=376150 RepID=UPI00224D1575|nr:tetratricopeptide repeat protein [Paraliomyxa miuraensis]MCX4239750.1 tetratricopeptide repeat protein [Paraliomyxa miuraensis]